MILSSGINLHITPVGLAYVASALRASGRYVSGFNASLYDEKPTQILLQRIKEEKIDVLCFSELSANYLVLRDTINIIRKHYPRVKIIVGGGIVSSDPEFIIQHLDMDFGCMGYGEKTICELATCIENNGDYKTIAGVIFKDQSGEIIKTAPRSEPESLDDFLFPALELFGFCGGLLPIIASRSCTHNCTFCFHPSGYKYRERSLDNIFKEIEYWKERFNITCIDFIDELFGYKNERILDFCNRIKKLGITFNLYLRVDIVTEELIKVLADSGCDSINYGIESMNQDVLDSMRKDITIKQIENALKLTSKYNIKIHGSIILGDPIETYEMAMESINWWFQNLHYGIIVGFVVAYPGTVLYKHAIKNRRITDPLMFLEERCPITNISAMNDVEFNKLLRMVDITRKLIGEPVTNLEIRKTDDDIFLFYADCPNCGETNFINYQQVVSSAFDPYGKQYKYCSQCNSRIKIAQQYQEHILTNQYFEDYSYDGKNVIIWGATQKAKFRLAANYKMRQAVVAVVDTAYDRFLDGFLGFTVQSPYILPKVNFDIIYIGSNAARKSILIMAEEVLGIGFKNKEVMQIE